MATKLIGFDENPSVAATASSVAMPFGRARRTRFIGEYSDDSFRPERIRPALEGIRRYDTFRSMEREVDTVGAAQAFLQQAASKAEVAVVPVGDAGEQTDEAKADAQLLRDMMVGMSDTPLDYILGQAAMHSLNGFTVLEWDGAFEDGVLHIDRYRYLPCDTIPRFVYDQSTTEVTGFVQRTYEDGGGDLFIPRWKTMYFSESAGTGSPRGRSLYLAVGSTALKWMQTNELLHKAVAANARKRPIVKAPIGEIQKEVRDRMQGTEGATEEAIKAAQDAEIRAQLKQVLDVVDQDQLDPDYSLLLDSAVHEGERYAGETHPISAPKWEVIWPDDIDVNSLREIQASREQNMARQLHIVFQMRGDSNSGSYALANTQVQDALMWAQSTLRVVVNEFNRLAKWLWEFNGMERECPVWTVKETAFWSTAEAMDFVLKWVEAALGKGVGAGADFDVLQQLLAMAGFATGGKVTPFVPPQPQPAMPTGGEDA